MPDPVDAPIKVKFPDSVERWRSTVARYVPSEHVNKALWIMWNESGGDPEAIGDGTASIGLFQIQHGGIWAGRPSADDLLDPETNIRYAAESLGLAKGNAAPWGEGTFGKPPCDFAAGIVTDCSFGAEGKFPWENVENIIRAGGVGFENLIKQTSDGSWEFIGNAFSSGGGGGVFGDVVRTIDDATGGGLDTVTGGITDAVTGVVKPIIEPLQAVGVFLRALGAWIFEPTNWARLAFYLVGGVMVAGGLYLLAKPSLSTSE